MTLSHIPKRTNIPRDTGLTMMMDKGLSTRQMEDFLSTSASYTDIIKFGFGTSIVSNNIQEKVALMSEVGVKPYFGGTMFELYYARNQEEDYFKIVDNFGIETNLYSQATRTVENVNNKPSGRIVIRRVGQ